MEHETDLEAMKSTRVIENTPSAMGELDQTELTPSRVLGKNVVTLGDYTLLKKLGEGAMGVVYLAHQESFNRHVALKVLFPHIASNPKLVERLYREGRVMGQLDHPNIVQAFAIGEDQGCYYVAMEYVDGENMQKWLDKLGRISVADALYITIESAKALEYAHRQEMIHRDVKPDNIIVGKKGVKVTDLGMVKTYDEDLSLTQTGHAVGTPWYMPLEQAKNSKESDLRSDIYALGCTLYAFLTGQPPFAGKTLVDVIQAKDVGTFPPARQFNPEVPERLDLIIAKMAHKSAKYRQQTCAEVIRDLESLKLAATSVSFLSRTGVEPKSKPKTPALPADAKKQKDSDVWYVRLKDSEGAFVAKKLTESQIRAKLEEGQLKPTIKASRNPDDGFRAIGTYKEFESVALAKISKKQSDQGASKFKDLYEQYNEKERTREESALNEPDLNPYLVWAKDNWVILSISASIFGLLMLFVAIGMSIR